MEIANDGHVWKLTMIPRFDCVIGSLNGQINFQFLISNWTISMTVHKKIFFRESLIAPLITIIFDLTLCQLCARPKSRVADVKISSLENFYIVVKWLNDAAVREKAKRHIHSKAINICLKIKISRSKHLIKVVIASSLEVFWFFFCYISL